MMWPDKIIAPLPEGTLARIKHALRDGESKTDFLREAVMRELARREQAAKQKPVAA